MTADEFAREGRLTFARIVELKLDPVQGKFDVAHLREVHRRIFQDLPHHDPGGLRPPAPGHIKNRVLEGIRVRYEVPYATRDIVDRQLAPRLSAIGGGATFRKLDTPAFVADVATLYGDLDYLHPFREGNSRTLRVFTDQLASESGHVLDWQLTGRDADSRNRLYMARDRAVIERAFPGLDETRAMSTGDRTEYEAYLTLQSIGSADSLHEIVRQSVELGQVRGAPVDQAHIVPMPITEIRRALADHLPIVRAQLAAQVEQDRIAALRRPDTTPRHDVGRAILERLDGPEGPVASLDRLEAAGVRTITVSLVAGQRAVERVRALDRAVRDLLREQRTPDRQILHAKDGERPLRSASANGVDKHRER